MIAASGGPGSGLRRSATPQAARAWMPDTSGFGDGAVQGEAPPGLLELAHELHLGPIAAGTAADGLAASRLHPDWRPLGWGDGPAHV